MDNTGKITRINSDLQYGFVQVAKLGDVFFSTETQFNDTTFESLKVNDSVQLSIVETERGLFAQSLCLNVSKARKDRTPELNP